MKTIINLLISFMIFISCSNDTKSFLTDSKALRIKNKSEIGPTIIEKFKNFNNWNFEDFKAIQLFSTIDLNEISEDIGHDVISKLNLKEVFNEMKDGGVKRKIDWSKIEYEHIEPFENFNYIGKETGFDYVAFEVFCFQEGVNHFSFIPIFIFDKSEYYLLFIQFDW